MNQPNHYRESRTLPTAHSTALAVSFAILLTFSNLFWGANYDITLAIFALISGALTLAFFLPNNSASTASTILHIIIASLLGFLALQYAMLSPASTISASISTPRLLEQTEGVMNRNLWMAEMGKLLWFFICLIAGHYLATHQHTARLFLRIFFCTGLLSVALTFMRSKRAISLSSEKFSHGFISENNAATYLGILLLICVAEILRYFNRVPTAPRLFIKKILLGNEGWKNLLWPALLMLAALMLLSALFATASRGGLIASFIGLAVMTGLHVLRPFFRPGRSPRRYRMVTATAFLLLTTAMLAFAQYGFKLDSILARDGLHDRFRPALYQSSLVIALEHPGWGAGLGNFPSIFPSYRPATLEPEGIYEYAHNSFLQFFVELGVAGLLLSAGLLLYAALRLLQRYAQNAGSGLDASLGLGLLGFICAHAMVDFPLQIPSLLCSFTLLILCCSYRAETNKAYPLRNSRFAYSDSK
jgi:O-antigen ligase